MKKNCIVAQSGGPTAAINASLAGVVDAAVSSGSFETVYGSLHGIEGILQSEYLDLSSFVKSHPENLTLLKQTPAMYLGSCRFKLPDVSKDPELYARIFQTFESMEIGAFFYIGGNDSMDTVLKLSHYATLIGSDIRVLGIPKTIDNDLCATDHTPGFGSAAKYIATTLLEVAYDTFIYQPKSVTIVEIMGRDAGWLTASAVLARKEDQPAPHLIYLPETAFSTTQFVLDVKKAIATYSNVIIAVSEGIRDDQGNYISASGSTLDNFGHVQLNGAGKTLEGIVKQELGVKVRSVEISVLQRCAEHLASATDLDESFSSGAKAVELAIAGKTGQMVTMLRSELEPYTIEYSSADIGEIANQAKSVPTEWITPEGNDVTQDMIDYLLPLIQGEIPLTYSDGLPLYANITHLLKHL